MSVSTTVVSTRSFFPAVTLFSPRDLDNARVHPFDRLRPQLTSQPSHGFIVRDFLASDTRKFAIHKVGPDQ